MRLDGRVAIVTGSSRGIGRAIALAYAREGARVIINSRNEKECAAVAAEIEGIYEAIGLGASDSPDYQETYLLGSLAQLPFKSIWP